MPEVTPEVLLGFDYGTRRIGVATGNTLTRTAQALVTLECRSGIPWPRIDSLLADYGPAQLVVGLPYNADGTPAQLAGAVRRFGRDLAARYARPVHFVDEHGSSQEAEAALRDARSSGALRRRVSHADVDKAAAREVLDRWFNTLP